MKDVEENRHGFSNQQTRVVIILTTAFKFGTALPQSDN